MIDRTTLRSRVFPALFGSLIPGILVVMSLVLALPASAQDGPIVSLGDSIAIVVEGRPDLSTTELVRDDGSVLLSAAEGLRIPAAGRSSQAVRQDVTVTLRSLYGEIEIRVELISVGREREEDPATPPPVLEAVEHTPQGALVRGLLVPGLGQIHTERTGRGILVLAAAGVGVGLALQTERKWEPRTFTDPFGNSYQSQVEVETYPLREVGIGLAVAALLGGAIEAYRYSSSRSEAEMARRVSPTVGVHGPHAPVEVGLQIRGIFP